MDLQLVGRRALITGSTTGIGAAIADRLAAEGGTVAIHGRDRQRAERRVQTIKSRGGQAELVLGDLSRRDGAQEVVDSALAGGPVDILVANTGPFAEHTFDSATDQDWVDTFQSNVVSGIGVIRGVLPGMRGNGWGRIVTVGSRAAAVPLPNMIDYSAAKAAVVNFTCALAKHLAGTGITANTVSPGVIVTPGMQRMFERGAAAESSRPWAELEAEITQDYAPNPTGRLGRPEDIAAAVAFLVSPVADYINGTTLRVDGGITPSINP